MALGKKYGGRDWVPGQSGNPAGRPAIPKDIRLMKKVDAREFEEMVARLTDMTIPEIQAYVKSGKATAREEMIIGQINAARKGSTSSFSHLLDRTIGPVKQKMDLNISGSISDRLANMTEEQKVEYLRQIQERDKS
jgi:hypothetical protein